MEAMFFRRKQAKPITFEGRLEGLRSAGFTVAPRQDGTIQVSRDGCAASIGSTPSIEHVGWLMDGEIAPLVDGGFQKFWRSSRRSAPALAQQLTALHEFEEDLREGLGLESLYNTSLGTVNGRHDYDRLAGR